MASEEKVKRRYRIVPCPSYDVERIESWLQDMAREGWLLEKDGSFVGVLSFLKSAPLAVRYRLEPKNKANSFDGSPDGDLLALCAEYGWEYVDCYSDFYIFRSTRPDAREMNTDLQLILLFNVYDSFLTEPTRSLVAFDFMLIPVTILLIWAIASAVSRSRYMHQLNRKLKANIPLDHNKPWKKGALFHIFTEIASTVFLFVYFGMLFGSCMHILDENFVDNSLYEGDPPFVTFSDICPEGKYTPKPFLAQYNQHFTYESYFAPTIIEWNEYGELLTPEGDTIQGVLRITYYETRYPWVARGLLEDYLREAEKGRHYTELAPPDIDTDSVVAYNAIYPTVLIRQGNIFIQAMVPLELNGEQSLLDDWARLMADMLTQ